MYEGYTVHKDTSHRQKTVLQQQYQLRRFLASYAAFPEGYEFQHGDRYVVLLTPPHQVAVHAADGTWSRQARDENIHGPAPYTESWYNGYLLESGLPQFFLGPEHLGMVANTGEAQALGVEPQALRTPPPAEYLQIRYPETPENVFMRDVDGEDAGSYHYTLTNKDRLRLARQFPAVNFPGRVKEVFLPQQNSGYIFISHNMNISFTEMGEADVEWRENEAAASYVSDDGPVPALAAALIVDKKERDAAIFDAHAAHAVAVPPAHHTPNGIGHWAFLQPVDALRANILGYGAADAVVDARRRGALSGGMRQEQVPHVVWYPDPVLLNPAAVPERPGGWEFYTAEAAKRAAQFGDQEAFGTAGVRNPTAAQIWRIRERFQMCMGSGETDADLTRGIDLVWMPDDADVSRTADEWERGDNDESKDCGYGIDERSGLAHNPLNPEQPNNQTAHSAELAAYETRMFGDTNITLDRGSARRGHPEEHKLWYHDGARWIKYHLAGSVDWSSRPSVDKLNKWREQGQRRSGWRLKREYSRMIYP
jgi:hypothetical protein